ncbi:MAG TPA: GDP-mannose 4,6-dehydratase [Verrucomicrobiae bacterium]|nr:GDP-mannose 4,6-dehydratase [Verrucomicrobiae bacterium]
MIKVQRNSNGTSKILTRHSGRTAKLLTRPRSSKRPVLITGGVGFIGTNVAHRLLGVGQPVLLYDNLSRPGVEQNLDWLQASHGRLAQIEVADTRNLPSLRKAVRHVSKIFHFAAQTAVTTSLEDPLHDFEINARGTLNLLEAVRTLENPPPIVFTSTNKVYGDLSDVKLRMEAGRYEPEDGDLRKNGFSESRPLHFHSPYGCSKGCAGQYVLDYTRTFRVPAVAFHMSCIYGPHQMGTEDQGWVAHFLIKALKNDPITVFGDGRQVRDILFVEELVDALLLAQKNMNRLAGQAFNIGGGPANSISLLELINLIGALQGQRPRLHFQDWRPADQRYYVSDIRKFSGATGWSPTVSARDGVTRLHQWLKEQGFPAARSFLKPKGMPAKRNGHEQRQFSDSDKNPHGQSSLNHAGGGH